jgi:hypothetical protein
MQIRQYVDNQLSDKGLHKIDLHIKICEECREKIQTEKNRTIQFKNTLETLYPQEIPEPDLSFLQDKGNRPKRFMPTRPLWAMAAMLLLVVFISLSLLIRKPSKSEENLRAMISTVRLNGNPAKSFIFSNTKPEMTIFWIEKVKQGEVK